jgi:hypothetical protein
MLSSAEVKSRIEDAFAPYRCGVEIEEVRDKVSFKVYRDEDDDNGTLLSGATLSRLRSGHLDRYIEVWREQIRDQGFAPS